MIKNSFFSLLMIGAFSCSKNDTENNLDAENYVAPKYDTLAIDSFSTGAISVDVAAQIRKSSVAYQDSITKVKVEAALAKKELEIKQKAENLEKEKLEAEKKKEKQKASTPKTE
ncbi:hypothetical protein [Frigoriflavimonas asaccharolytica]|uniref:Lipoprotein n=1 Tax=Frigoriflavimonas asaccharolytica TaxID=2735899 RepID=A0A8J8G701_9FLAO|nr:hypothetical protein [Frigoriflavimonas asaccharolytica]NRS91137.1 hypothetical protein [Frigoriflavimonas asaccharolytica]